MKFLSSYKLSNIIKNPNYEKRTSVNFFYNDVKNNLLLDKNNFMNSNSFVKNKKIISISPGGLKGIYILGTCTYLKQHFNFDDYIFSGASAGSWNSLVMCYKNDPLFIKKEIIDYSIKMDYSINEIELKMKERLLTVCSSEDFYLNRLYIGATVLYNSSVNTYIFYNFNNLEDAVNCCIGSSHIPVLTGGLLYNYNNKLTFDGGFSRYPYLDIKRPVLHITPNIWNYNKNENKGLMKNIHQYTTLFSKNSLDIYDMFSKGYFDAKKHHELLEYIL